MDKVVKKKRVIIELFGLVQGVGFRPSLFHKASEFSLLGTISNTDRGVRCDLEGKSTDLDQFIQTVSLSLSTSRIDDIEITDAELKGHSELKITHSQVLDDSRISIPPDRAICAQCFKDYFNPGHRLYKYPLISCSECGPKFSIMKSFPFDRANTSLSAFPMCHNCESDYSNPSSRRFHMQGLNCAECGPKLSEALDEISQKLNCGHIGIIKGLTGYHLVGDATKFDVVARIRKLKSRPEKSLGLMIRDQEALKSIHPTFKFSNLKTPANPLMVIQNSHQELQDLLAPGLSTLAVMAAPTPYHQELMKECPFLICTSANPANFPLIAQLNELPEQFLNGVDFVLDHDRPLLHPVDDSVVFANGNVLRLGRGLAPRITPAKNSHTQIHYGSDMKCAPLIATPNQLIQLPTFGDLSELKILKRVKKEIDFYKLALRLKVEQECIDAHPQTHAQFLTETANPHKIFHHHAHAEALYRQKGVEVVMTFDGTGFGADEMHWGGEILKRNHLSWSRLAHFDPMPILGGELMMRKPALSYQALLSKEKHRLQTTSAGRWFDALAAHLFFGEREMTYEAQAAMELEHFARAPLETFDWKNINFTGDFPTKHLALFIIQELSSRFNPHELAYLAHDGLAYLITRWMINHQVTSIGACGGVFHNQLLLERIHAHFKQNNLTLMTLSELPPGDESIALGQWGLTCMN
ncbi:MAG: carbamoyltransferase HypF [Bdellovibrio sp.]